MYNAFARFISSEDGATAIEYALIAAATGLALIAVMPTIGVNLTDQLTPLGPALAGSTP